MIFMKHFVFFDPQRLSYIPYFQQVQDIKFHLHQFLLHDLGGSICPMVHDKIRLNLVMKKSVEKDPTENRYFNELIKIYYDQII